MKDENGVGELMNMTQAAKRIGVHYNTLRRWIIRGEFPQPRRFTARTLRWPVSVVEQFVEGRAVKSCSA